MGLGGASAGFFGGLGALGAGLSGLFSGGLDGIGSLASGASSIGSLAGLLGGGGGGGGQDQQVAQLLASLGGQSSGPRVVNVGGVAPGASPQFTPLSGFPGGSLSSIFGPNGRF